MPVGVSTGHWISPGGAARLGEMRRWDVSPDYVSVNLFEPDALDVMALMDEMGIAVEAGLHGIADVERFVTRGPAGCCRILIEIPADLSPRDACTLAGEMLALLDAAQNRLPVLLHGFDGNAWALVEMAAERGLDTRIGFEDTILMPDGTPAANNASLVRAAAEIMG